MQRISFEDFKTRFAACCLQSWTQQAQEFAALRSAHAQLQEQHSEVQQQLQAAEEGLEQLRRQMSLQSQEAAQHATSYNELKPEYERTKCLLDTADEQIAKQASTHHYICLFQNFVYSCTIGLVRLVDGSVHMPLPPRCKIVNGDSLTVRQPMVNQCKFISLNPFRVMPPFQPCFVCLPTHSVSA